ncbi:response regulator transcription factor [Pseudomonas shahriarae]|uniref:Response regulator transcription factor n=1 Tax=Pseudomonas shahriarae TaxID=2745512 RepID=A0ABT5NF01_9PSED|nr:response regulator transcription factor [Pseudomonas shahriarae]MDD0986397.1 response regulator transcription factor [Pseudomonas shahriarae]MDD1034276.1 response regulator transcription factor [Pseudomonas shahriarae]
MGSVKQQSTPIKIVVADDHPVVVMGVSKMIGELDGIRVVATATTISQLFECLSKAHCDILVCDYSFENDKEPDGLLLLDKIRRLYPEVKIILLTAHDDLVIVQRAVKAGVSGFLSKASNDMTLISSVIARVYSGEKYLDPLTSKAMLQHMMSGELSVPTLLTSNLTARELEVVRMFSRGMSVTDIAHYTDRSIKTISTQKKQAMLKLGACNDVELVNAFGKLF